VFVLVLALLLPAVAPGTDGPTYSPFAATMLATADAEAVVRLADPKIDQEDIVYVSMHNWSLRERLLNKGIVDLVVNSLNTRYRGIVRTAAIPSAENPIVLRINLRDYGISKKAWERLVSTGSGPVPLPEPYFYTRIQKVINNDHEEEYETTEKELIGYYNGDRNRPAYKEVMVKKKRMMKGTPTKETVLATAPWIALETDVPGKHIARLLSVTQNKFPIVRADWFITYAPWAPAYYDLIGLKRRPNPDEADAKKNPVIFLEKDFEALFGFDFEAARLDIVAAITDTKIVTLHNRILQRFSTIRGTTGGSYWRSQDTDTGIDDEEYLNNVGNFDRPKIKAQEGIATGRNGLQFYMLSNNKGVLLSVAAASIAIHGDTMPTKFTDKQVYAARNCMLCHAGGQLYLKDKVRNIARHKIALFIAEKTKDKEVAKKIEEAFSPDTRVIIDTDNAKFVAAVRAASSMDAKDAGVLFEHIVNEYYYRPISMERMAWEAGVKHDKLDMLLRRGIGIDHTLTSVLQDPPEDVYRLTWERQGYAALMQYLLSVGGK
jgi:hypothetical protein